MTNLLPLGNLPLGVVSFRRFDDVQPFSIRSHASYENIQHEIVCYLRDQLTPYLENESLAVATLQAMVNTMTQDILAVGNADDIVIIALLQNAATQTRGWLDARYLQTGNLDTALDNVVTGTAPSTVRTWLDGRYFHKPAPGRNGITGWFHVEDYGAVGDGVTDDRAAIQAAIDAANADYLITGNRNKVFGSKKYLVGVQNYYLADGTTQAGVVGLLLRSGVELFRGSYLAKPGSYGAGAQYGLIRSVLPGVTDAGLREVKIDGNRANQVASVQCSTVVLEAVAGVSVIDCTVTNANGDGIMVRGAIGTPATNIRINGNRVTNTNRIGIQAAQFDGLEIRNNFVQYTTDNGIDVYGETGAATADGGNHFTISGNRVQNCPAGIFLETVANGIVEGNQVLTCTQGIHINRTNGQPFGILISGNYLRGGEQGIWMTGEGQDILIRGNHLESWNTGCVVLGGAGGNTSVGGVSILDNMMNGNADTTPLVLVVAGTIHIVNSYHARTITRSGNRAFDTVLNSVPAVSFSYGPAMHPGD